jgi:hypothetical protein
MLVKPAPGLKVRDPRTKQLIDPEGVELPIHDLDFARLLTDGDLVECKPQTASADAVVTDDPDAAGGDLNDKETA